MALEVVGAEIPLKVPHLASKRGCSQIRVFLFEGFLRRTHAWLQGFGLRDLARKALGFDSKLQGIGFQNFGCKARGLEHKVRAG